MGKFCPFSNETECSENCRLFDVDDQYSPCRFTQMSNALIAISDSLVNKVNRTKRVPPSPPSGEHNLLITKERFKQGLSMAALSRKAGMQSSCISQIESGRLKPYPGQVSKLADALGWTGNPEDLFKEVD